MTFLRLGNLLSNYLGSILCTFVYNGKTTDVSLNILSSVFQGTGFSYHK